jgi:hypothetical protein
VRQPRNFRAIESLIRLAHPFDGRSLGAMRRERLYDSDRWFMKPKRHRIISLERRNLLLLEKL